MNIFWRDALRHMLQVLAFCCVVAVLTTAIWPRDGYLVQLGQSAAIGLTTWAVIEFGRLLVNPKHCYTSHDGDHGWPRGWRGVALAGVGIACGFFIGDAIGNRLFTPDTVRSDQDNYLGLIITIVAGAVATFYFYTRGKAAALEAGKAAAERDASEARLMLLQSQLEPHMLFNTLANLRALIGVDPAAAQRMLDRLNGYLRSTLEASRSTQHPLAAEFARLADYLELMAIRMGPRLEVALELPPELADLPVPPLILQPLVENAIQHGLEPQVAGGRITVSAARQGDALQLTVADTGAGFDAAQARPNRFGMAQVTERMRSAYGDRGGVDVQSAPGQGTTVRLTLPLEETAT